MFNIKRKLFKTKSTTFTPPNIIILFIVYVLNTLLQDLNSNLNFTLKECLFRGVKLTKNVYPDKYVYIGYGIGFNFGSEFSLPDGNLGKNVIIFRADMSSSVHIDNKQKDNSWFRSNTRVR